jgi:hypothetical protein
MSTEPSPSDHSQTRQSEAHEDLCSSNFVSKVDDCSVEAECSYLGQADEAIAGLRQALLGQFVPDQEMNQALGL